MPPFLAIFERCSNDDFETAVLFTPTPRAMRAHGLGSVPDRNTPRTRKLSPGIRAAGYIFKTDANLLCTYVGPGRSGNNHSFL